MTYFTKIHQRDEELEKYVTNVYQIYQARAISIAIYTVSVW